MVWGKYFTVDEHPASRLADVPNIQYRQVTPNYVRALGIRVIEGRFFNDDDTAERPRVAVINESARRRYFPNVSPIGKLVYPGPPEATVRHLLPSPDFRIPRFTVIGVIADVKHSGLRRAAEPELFVSHAQGAAKDNETPSTKMFLMIKTDNDPLRLAFAVRAASIARSRATGGGRGEHGTAHGNTSGDTTFPALLFGELCCHSARSRGRGCRME